MDISKSLTYLDRTTLKIILKNHDNNKFGRVHLEDVKTFLYDFFPKSDVDNIGNTGSICYSGPLTSRTISYKHINISYKNKESTMMNFLLEHKDKINITKLESLLWELL